MRLRHRNPARATGEGTNGAIAGLKRLTASNRTLRIEFAQVSAMPIPLRCIS